MGHLNYVLHNERVTAAREAIILTLDTSMLWNHLCLIEVFLVWGGRSEVAGSR